MKSFEEQVSQRCVHFTGLMDSKCRAGVAYADVRDPVARPLQIPCINTGGSCDKCQFPTREEVEKQREEMGKAALTGIIVADRIKTLYKKTGATQGAVACECGGRVRFMIASNGHIRAKCSGCGVSIME